MYRFNKVQKNCAEQFVWESVNFEPQYLEDRDENKKFVYKFFVLDRGVTEISEIWPQNCLSNLSN